MRPGSPAPPLALWEALLPAFTSSQTDNRALLLATLELPCETDPLDLWSALPEQQGVFWDTADETIAGVGVCLGPEAETLSRIRAAVRLPSTSTPAGDAPTPRLFGALPFSPGWVDEEWCRLGGPGFVLPRWTLFHRAGDATLQLAVEGPVSDSDRSAIAAELARIEAALSSGLADRGVWGRPAAATIPAGQDAASWAGAVDAALTEIQAGRLQKVVLSRFVNHEFSRPLSAIAVLRQLSDSSAGRYRFGLRRGDTAFVGASPECLFDKRGSVLRVEALAGTYDLGRDDTEAGLIKATEHLFASGKDLEEQSLVVRGILDALAPLSVSVTAGEWPAVREARGLAHLSTDVTARLRPGVTPMDLIDALHPTPAVGGLPRPEALSFIREVEEAPRGLFAAPVGWISPEGDACLAVAIRSALLTGDRARVYAGAGIVAASDASSEWEETAAKLRWLYELTAEAAQQ
jgi:isochorismate synthase